MFLNWKHKRILVNVLNNIFIIIWLVAFESFKHHVAVIAILVSEIQHEFLLLTEES
jgi:hypothetical protein